MRWIDTTNLKQWAHRRDCQEHLALVLRRLIRATSEGFSHILFPAGDSVLYGGWDGVLQATSSTEYIPEGSSVWEIGTNQKIKDKAEDDYQKRTKDPLGADPATTTFVFVTPRIWPKKDNWCRGKQAEGKWKDVRVYDAEILEEWLEQAPAVGAWLAKYLNIFPEGVEAADDFWEEWTSATTPSLTSGLVLAGRKKQAEEVRNWLNSQPSLLTVQAASSEEALAFLVAVAERLPETEKENFFSRCLMVENIKSFRAATSTRNVLVLARRFEETDADGRAVQDGHHVYVPIGLDNTVARDKIVLPRLEREAFVSALKEIGLTEDKAQKYSKETGRSLSVLRRQLSGAANQPKWARQETAREFLPALLIGRWTEQKKPDREALSRIAREPYEALSGKLTRWLMEPDSPLYKIGDSWRLTSPIDAWFALAPYLTSEDLENFKNVALDVLSTVNPALELEPDKRWMASVYGKEPPHSGWLREGIAQTFVLIAVFGNEAGVQAVYHPQAWVNILVKELLHKADWQKWFSLTDVLPIIAEASPSSFLDPVEESLAVDKSTVIVMFSETSDVFTSSRAHVCLLWALEGLAWDPSLLSRVTAILGKLAKLNFGGQSANSPTNSLRNIFLLWLPQTYASLDIRMTALDMLLEQEPEVGWNLLVALVPRIDDHCIPTSKPRWRQYPGRQDNTVTLAEHLAGITAIKDKLLEQVGCDGNRWAELIDKMPYLPAEGRQAVVEHLASCAGEITLGREKLWEVLRHILSAHRSFPDADWALPEIELKKIEEIYTILEPLDIRQRFAWLFDSRDPEFPEGREMDDFNKRKDVTEQYRQDAVTQIRKTQGIEGIFTLAHEVKSPGQLGITTAQISIDPTEEDKVLSLLNSDKNKELSFAQGYVHWCASQKGDDWVAKVIDKSRKRRWQVDMVINFFLALPENRDVWNHVETFGPAVREGYWKKCWAGFYHVSSNDKAFGIKQLLSVGRFFTALYIAAIIAKDLPSSLVLEVLQKAATAPADTEDMHSFNSHDVVRLFEVLGRANDIDNKQMAQLEWVYLPILAKEWLGYHPKTLHKELTNNPAFFAEVIKWLCKPKDDTAEGDNQGLTQEMIGQRAYLAHDLLSSWKIIPGSNSDGQIDTEKLQQWVQEARRLCTESGRDEVGDSYIGEVLAHVKAESEEVWPPEPVCQVIDRIQSSALEDGFHVGIINKLGETTRSRFEGGNQERGLARRFRQYSDDLAARWPRTASVLSRVAESYENEAKRIDKEAEQRDLEY